MPQKPPDDGQSPPFRKGLNVHGFGFHYAVIHQILVAGRIHGWEFIGAEVPIALNGKETHADLIFYNKLSGVYLVGECKRVDPSLAQWVPRNLVIRLRSREIEAVGDPLVEVRDGCRGGIRSPQRGAE
jgi:hypothetical protein